MALFAVGFAPAGPASIATGKILVVFVHGFRGADVIADSVRLSKRGDTDSLRRAAFAEHLVYYDAFLEYSRKITGRAIDFLAYKYNTYSGSNIGAARFLNMVLKGEVSVDQMYPYNNILPKGAKLSDYSEIYFITESNGNLVVREAILQAFGLKDDSRTTSNGSIDYQRVLSRAPIASEVKRTNFFRIERDEELIKAYNKSTVFDISPILGGPAFARSAKKPFYRFAELDPFGRHNQWLFSKDHVKLYNAALSDRHYTFFIAGDFHSGGIWKQFFGAREPGFMLGLAKFSTLTRLQSWKAQNLRWLVNFERARGKDKEHNIEFFQRFPGPDKCRLCGVTGKNSRLKALNEEEVIQNSYENDPLFRHNFSDRLNLSHSSCNDGYGQDMSQDINDYYVSECISIYRKGWIGRALISGFYQQSNRSIAADQHALKLKPLSEMTLNERHTVLLFYKPLLEHIGAIIFGTNFATWVAARNQPSPLAPSVALRDPLPPARISQNALRAQPQDIRPSE